MGLSFVRKDGSWSAATLQPWFDSVSPADAVQQVETAGADPTDVCAWADTARIFERRTHAVALYGWALRQLEDNPNLIAPDTNLSGAYYFYGKLLIMERRPADALVPLRAAVTMKPRDASSLDLLGTALFLLDDHDQAATCFKKALGLRGADEYHDEEFFTMVEDKLRMVDERRQASPGDVIAEIERIAPGCPGALAALFQKAVDAYNARAFEQAAISYERAIADLGALSASAKAANALTPSVMAFLAEHTAGAWATLGACTFKTGGIHINRAAHAFLEALELGHEDADGAIRQAVSACMEKANGLHYAMRFDRAPQLPEEQKRAFSRWHNEGLTLLKKPYPPGTPGRNWQGAVNMLSEALDIVPDSLPTLHLMGLALDGAGDEEGAIAAWRKVHRLDPDHDFEVRIKFDDARMDEMARASEARAEAKAAPAPAKERQGFWKRLLG